MDKNQLIEYAKAILSENRKDGYTIPGEGIYPFQWKWDSGFIALGYSCFDIEKAMVELETLFLAQWKNGFVPHIIFHSVNQRNNYFPDAEFYLSSLSPYANHSFETTTLTQPPVEGWVLEKIYEAGKGEARVREFVKKLFHKVVLQHKYLYDNRDPYGEGLVYIQHNWESGTDNAPVWDEIWDSFSVPAYNFSRKDTQTVKEEQRPSKKEYDYYLYLVDLFKKWQYDDREIAEKSPFLVQDPLFNSMLIASNQSLIRLGMKFGFLPDVKQLEKWNQKSKEAMNRKLFDAEAGLYRHYNLRTGRWLRGFTSSGFVPLFAGVPSSSQAKRMVQAIKRFSAGGKYFFIPSLDPADDRFEPQRYWRGPAWINMNWLVMEGLKDYGEHALANRLREDTLQMVSEQGFFEYFEPEKKQSAKQHKGYGGSRFSWTAALIIQILNESL